MGGGPLRRAVVRTNRPLGATDVPRALPRLRIGLLGGSFNPAHGGHLAISLEALRHLRLDRVWWLVSPQNPLKPRDGMADLAERMASARRVVSRHPRVHVTDLERRIGTRYSVDTVRWLTRHGRAKFVWLMGADNLAQLPRWRHWRRLMALVPIAVFDREPYSHWVVAGRVATAYAARRLADGSACVLADRSPPAWVYLRLRRHQESSTAIRRADAAGGRAAHEEEERP